MTGRHLTSDAFPGAQFLIGINKCASTTEEISVLSKRVIDCTDMRKPVEIYLYQARNGCQKKIHDLESVNAIVRGIRNDKTVIIDIDYCLLCNKYFINSSLLAKYEKRNGVLLFYRIVDDILPDH